MRLILKYRYQIVSIGLIPIIITLIGLHFFPNTQMLGAGFVLSIIMLSYNIIKMKDLNFFLFLGTSGIGLCFFLRLFWGYRYVPLNTITPTVEFSLLAFAFIYHTAPEIYSEILGKLGIRNYFSYQLETKVIILLSSVHLISLYIISSNFEWTKESWFFMVNVIPVSIYIICFIINVTGIRLAAAGEIYKNNIIRIAPLYDGKIWLSRNLIAESVLNKDSKWDLPVERSVETSLKSCDKYAVKTSRNFFGKTGETRLIMRYSIEDECGNSYNVLLYILPVRNRESIKNKSGRFFTFEEIENNPDIYSENIFKEYEVLKNAAEQWKDFYL